MNHDKSTLRCARDLEQEIRAFVALISDCRPGGKLAAFTHSYINRHGDLVVHVETENLDGWRAVRHFWLCPSGGWCVYAPDEYELNDEDSEPEDYDDPNQTNLHTAHEFLCEISDMLEVRGGVPDIGEDPMYDMSLEECVNEVAHALGSWRRVLEDES